MKAEFDVKLTTGDLYRFLMHNTYRKIIGIVWLVFSAAVIVVVVLTWGQIQLLQSILLLVLASLYTIINPIMLLFRAHRQIKNTPSFRKPLHYVVDEEGITVSQDDACETTPWSNMWKAVKYGNQYVVYVTNIRVFNIPIRCLQDQTETLKELARQGLAERCKI